jgi:hypothetical protein
MWLANWWRPKVARCLDWEHMKHMQGAGRVSNFGPYLTNYSISGSIQRRLSLFLLLFCSRAVSDGPSASGPHHKSHIPHPPSRVPGWADKDGQHRASERDNCRLPMRCGAVRCDVMVQLMMLIPSSICKILGSLGASSMHPGQFGQSCTAELLHC